MSDARSGSNRVLLIVVGIVLLILLLLLGRCVMKPSAAPTPPVGGTPAPAPSIPTPAPGADMPLATGDVEKLTPATLKSAAKVTAGAEFRVGWTGPGNEGDYVTIVPVDAPPDRAGNYADTRAGAAITITAPMEPGPHELRYVTVRSKTVLARAAIEVEAAAATIKAPERAVAGTDVAIEWTGPNNAGDYITFADPAWPDDRYGNYTDAATGSPLKVQAPIEPGAAEIRYVSGQGRKVLGRRGITIVAAEVTLSAPDRGAAGSKIDIAWTGPGNAGDYITIVPKGWADEKYGNYENTSKANPLPLDLPILDGPEGVQGIGGGEAEIRYVSGQGRRVLARRGIVIEPVRVTFEAPAKAKAGEKVSITWTGPGYTGDYITIVPKGWADNKFGDYTNAKAGAAASVLAPKAPGEAEIRYVAGQGGRVLGRRAIIVE